MKQFFKNLFQDHFQNWSKNIVNMHAKVFYPKNDEEIKNLIAKATENEMKIRVAGSKHSATPMVVDNNEKNIMVVSLEKYNSEENFLIDHDRKVVTVNAGWKLGELYDKLNKHNYLLETQTASSAFSVGGVCCIPVHGGRLGAGIISDSIVGLRIIDEDGNASNISNQDTDIDIYRLNYGLLGIITHISLKIISVNNISAKTSNFYNIFYDSHQSGYKIKKKMLDNYFKPIIEKCISPNGKIEYNQCFIDCHNNTMLALDWADDDKKYIIREPYLDVRKINNFKTPEIFFGTLSKNFRTNKKFLKASGKIIRHSIMYNIEDNMGKDRDMLWVENAVRAVFMSYFIPVYDEKHGIQLDNLYEAIEFVMNLVQKFGSDSRKFNIDLPIDLRFVASSKKCRLSPLYSKKKKVYAAIELVCTGYNLETNSDKISEKKINQAFREFFYTIEQKWIELGGIAHFGKIFGFGGENCDPFDPLYINSVLPDHTKSLIRSNMQPLFTNNFVRNLMAENDIKNK